MVIITGSNWDCGYSSQFWGFAPLDWSLRLWQGKGDISSTVPKLATIGQILGKNKPPGPNFCANRRISRRFSWN